MNGDKLMMCNRLYNDLSYLWPLVSFPQDYAKEASYWRRVLREKLEPGRHKILELGVGGGHHLSHLTDDFQATAVDLSESMLAHSQRLNPGVEHQVGDMRTVRLNKKFSAVLIHDAIGYILTEKDLIATFKTAAIHLKLSGIFIMAPDNFRETFQEPRIHHEIRSSGAMEVTYVEYEHDPDPQDSMIESIIVYFIREKGALHIEQDRHVLGLFPLQTWLDLMNQAGFDVEKVPHPVHDDGREAYLLVGTLREGT